MTRTRGKRHPKPQSRILGGAGALFGQVSGVIVLVVLGYMFYDAQFGSQALQSDASKLRFIPLGKKIDNSRVVARILMEKTGKAYLDDQLLYRTPNLLGGDYRIFDHLRGHFQPGTKVQIEFNNDDTMTVHRAGRFVLVLLPEYPIDSTSELVITPAGWVKPGDEVLERGEVMVLVRRKAAGGGGG